MFSPKRIDSALRRFRRGAVAVLAVAPALAFAAAPASATPHTGGKDAEAAAVIHTHGKKCEGAKVPRCVWLRVDHTNNRVRAYAEVHDTADRYPYDVQVNGLRFRANPGNVKGYKGDIDGWQPYADGAWTKLIPCSNNTRYTFSLEAQFFWRNANTGNADSDTVETYYNPHNC